MKKKPIWSIYALNVTPELYILKIRVWKIHKNYQRVHGEHKIQKNNVISFIKILLYAFI